MDLHAGANPRRVAGEPTLAAGEYRIRVVGKLDTTGAYTIKTNYVLPPKAKTQKKGSIGPKANGTPVTLVSELLVDATLDMLVLPKKTITGPLDLEITGPSGPIDPGAALQPVTVDGVDGIELIDLPITETGTHTIVVTGLASTKEKVSVLLTPTQPLGTSSVPAP